MTPRERVLSAIHHQEPDRVPFSWGLGITPEMRRTLEAFSAGRGFSFDGLRMAVEDVRTISPDYAGPELPERTDYWGVRRASVSYAGGEYDEIEHYPLAAAETVADLDNHRWPDPAWFDFSTLRADIERSDPEHRFAYRGGITVSGNPLERYTWMTGLEQTLVNLLINPEVVHGAMRRINDFFLGMMERVSKAAGDYIDIFYFADDLGGQSSLLMSRETYQDVIKPYHAELIARSKELLPTSKAMFHTDGAVFDIIPDLLDAGVEILEAVQTDATGMDPARLKSNFGERLAFHGGIPVQSLLPNEDEATVRARCNELVDVFGAGGGYIAAPTHAIQHGTPPENVMAMLESVMGAKELAAAVERAKQRG